MAVLILVILQTHYVLVTTLKVFSLSCWGNRFKEGSWCWCVTALFLLDPSCCVHWNGFMQCHEEMLLPDQLAWILDAPSAVWHWDGWFWEPGSLGSMNEGANGAVSECFSDTEQSPSELARSVPCGSVFYCSIDGLRENCCTPRLSGVLDWEFRSFYLSLKYRPAEWQRQKEVCSLPYLSYMILYLSVLFESAVLFQSAWVLVSTMCSVLIHVSSFRFF